MSLADPAAVKNTGTEDVQDLNLSAIRKKRFRIDGDNNRILELNVSDLNVLSRLRDTYPKLVKLSNEAATNLPDVDESTEGDLIESEAFNKTIDTLKDIDKKMREYMDYIFDANVSEVCVQNGSMYDPFNGKLRFEHILDILTNLYETNLNAEFEKLSSRVKKHTAKYTKPRKK